MTVPVALSPRQAEIAKLVVADKSSREIGEFASGIGLAGAF